MISFRQRWGEFFCSWKASAIECCDGARYAVRGSGLFICLRSAVFLLSLSLSILLVQTGRSNQTATPDDYPLDQPFNGARQGARCSSHSTSARATRPPSLNRSPVVLKSFRPSARSDYPQGPLLRCFCFFCLFFRRPNRSTSILSSFLRNASLAPFSLVRNRLSLSNQANTIDFGWSSVASSDEWSTITAEVKISTNFYQF